MGPDHGPKSAKQQGSRLLTNADIVEAVAKGQAEKAEKLGLSQEWVLRRLMQVVERCLQAEAVVDRKGERVMIETPEGEMGAAYTFQAAGANRALELLGKHLNLFNETVKHQHEPEPEGDQGNNGEARQLFRRAVEANPHNAAAWMQWSIMEELLGKRREAIDVARKGNAYVPDDQALHAQVLKLDALSLDGRPNSGEDT